ncbi:MAG TPA: serine/threonine-protein kinase, partial [Gemmataceae bacterium]|nr:serine/threonine-protein kinase [Gemmataceae bacterium]
MAPDTSAQPTQLGNYDVLVKIADGGMGTVYKARSRTSGEVVAIKVIAPGPARNAVMLQRFEREFMAAKVLEHPNVVRAIEYCTTGQHPFLVMEYVDGESVGQRLERAGAIPEDEAIGLIVQVCDGLQRAHKQGLVHRDVKPDNILITRDGVAKLTDLGLVKVEAELNLTKTGRGLGTPHYMAPEQFRNAKGVDVRGDIYSLGATLYAMITGATPFTNASPLDCWMKKIRNEFPAPRELNRAVSERVDWAIRRAMSAEPSLRPATCREFVEDLTGQSRVVSVAAAAVRPVPVTPAPQTDLWYLVYRDETGQVQTVKGGTDAIRRALADGLMGDTSAILVGRSKAGQFQPLNSVPEFRDLVVSPAPLPTGPGRSSGVVPRESGAVVQPGQRSGAHRRPDDAAVDSGIVPP